LSATFLELLRDSSLVLNPDKFNASEFWIPRCVLSFVELTVSPSFQLPPFMNTLVTSDFPPPFTLMGFRPPFSLDHDSSLSKNDISQERGPPVCMIALFRRDIYNIPPSISPMSMSSRSQCTLFYKSMPNRIESVCPPSLRTACVAWLVYYFMRREIVASRHSSPDPTRDSLLCTVQSRDAAKFFSLMSPTLALPSFFPILPLLFCVSYSSGRFGLPLRLAIRKALTPLIFRKAVSRR